MTTRCELPGDLFAGEVVAVLAPGVTQEQADSVRQYKRIAIRRAFQVAPDADMLVALDGSVNSLDDAFWSDTKDFPGVKISGTESDDIDALYCGLHYESVVLGEGHTISIRNNGLAAIRIAARAGAKKILLLGFDAEQYESVHGFVGLVQGLKQLTAELRASGIEVEAVAEIEAPQRKRRA